MRLIDHPYLRLLTFFIGIPASFLTILFVFKSFFDSASSDARFGMAMLAIFAAFFFLFAMLQEYRFSRKARYAEAMIYLYQIFRLCFEGTFEDQNSEKQICKLGEQICDQLSHAFSLITGTRCSACIKVLDDYPGYSDRISVGTLCRDTASIQRQQSLKDLKHWIEANSDYVKMFETMNSPAGGTYFENNLPKKHGYNNTSFFVYGEPKDLSMPMIRGFYRNLTWPLPYKSTIGAAIYPINPKSTDILTGFLCIDSGSRNVFVKRYDVNIIRGISAGLHPIMLKWSEIVIKKKGGNNGK